MAKKKKKVPYATRLLRIRERLNRQGAFITVKWMRDKFGVCRKTVYNDIAALREAGVDIESDKGPEGEVRWRLSSKGQNITVNLGQTHVVPFGIALQALSFLEGTEVHGQIEDIMERLFAGASTRTKQTLNELRKKVTIVPHGPKSYGKGKTADILNWLLTGLTYNEAVKIRYRAASTGQLKDHEVEPLSLVLYREAVYLIADSRSSGLRTCFAVDRITSARRLKGDNFDYPQDYDPAKEFRGAFGLVGGKKENVEIIFEAKQAQYVKERRWHRTQKFEDLPDGRVKMTMKVAGTQDLLYWLVGHTGTFEVVSPPSLKKDVQAKLRQATKAHKDKRS